MRFPAPRDLAGDRLPGPESQAGGPFKGAPAAGELPRAREEAGGRARPGGQTSRWALHPQPHLFISRHCIPRLCHACPALVWPRVLLKGSAPQLGLLGRPNDKS